MVWEGSGWDRTPPVSHDIRAKEVFTHVCISPPGPHTRTHSHTHTHNMTRIEPACPVTMATHNYYPNTTAPAAVPTTTTFSSPLASRLHPYDSPNEAYDAAGVSTPRPSQRSAYAGHSFISVSWVVGQMTSRRRVEQYNPALWHWGVGQVPWSTHTHTCYTHT